MQIMVTGILVETANHHISPWEIVHHLLYRPYSSFKLQASGGEWAAVTTDNGVRTGALVGIPLRVSFHTPPSMARRQRMRIDEG